MPIDASIYQNIRPVEAPSVMDSLSKAQSLRSMGMQQQQQQQQLDSGQMQAHLQKAQTFGQALKSVASLPPEQQPQAYAQTRNELIQNGIIKPQDAPEQHDPMFLNSMVQKYDQTAPAIENRLKQAHASLFESEAIANRRKSGSAKGTFDQLPPENQEQIKDIARKNAAKTSIKNQIDSVTTILDDPKVTEDQKVVAGQQLLKTLNSSEGQDAVGAEESKRLGSLLQKKMFNFLQPGSVFGRDVGEFTNQVKLTSGALGQSLARNNAEIDRNYGRQARAIPPIEIPVGAMKPIDSGGGLMSNAVASERPAAPPQGMLLMEAPNGKRKYVKASDKAEAIAAGGKVVK